MRLIGRLDGMARLPMSHATTNERSSEPPTSRVGQRRAELGETSSTKASRVRQRPSSRSHPIRLLSNPSQTPCAAPDHRTCVELNRRTKPACCEQVTSSATSLRITERANYRAAILGHSTDLEFCDTLLCFVSEYSVGQYFYSDGLLCVRYSVVGQ